MTYEVVVSHQEASSFTRLIAITCSLEDHVYEIGFIARWQSLAEIFHMDFVTSPWQFKPLPGYLEIFRHISTFPKSALALASDSKATQDFLI